MNATKMSSILLLLLTVSCNTNAFLPSLSDIKALIDFSYDMFGKLNEIYNRVDKFQVLGISITNVLSAVNEMAENLDTTGARLERKMEMIMDTMLDRLPEITDIKSDMQLLRNYISRIDALYSKWRSFYLDTRQWNTLTIYSFAKAVTGYNSYTPGYIIDMIFSVIIPRRTEIFKRSLLVRLSKSMKESHLNSCDEGKPAQQQLYEMYAEICLTELRAYLIIVHSYLLRTTLGEGSFIGEIQNIHRNFELRIATYTYVFQQATRWAPRTIRRCDPTTKHVRGKTFHEFERFINAYVTQENVLNPKNNCEATCETTKTPTVRYADLQHTDIESSRTSRSCHGTIVNCTSVGGRMEICASPCTNQQNCIGGRRYQWLKAGDGVKYGNTKEKCRGPVLHPVGKTRGIYYCDVCMCTCVEDSYSYMTTRSVSLRAVLSDVTDNKVITGLKFVSLESVVQIQIQEGKLGKDGTIEENSATWKNPERIRYLPVTSWQNKKHIFQLVKPHHTGTEKLVLDKDLATFNHQNRSINLDELHVPADYVMTGIKFDRIVDKAPNLNPIQLSIRATPFDYDTGRLMDIDKSTWITAKDMKTVIPAYDEERTEIVYPENARNPIGYKVPTAANLEPNKWIEIGKTGLKSDAGQTVIPLLDGLEVVADPALPLAGVNLFHKSVENYGGFLSFQLVSIDRSEYISAEKIHLRESYGNGIMNVGGAVAKRDPDGIYRLTGIVNI